MIIPIHFFIPSSHQLFLFIFIMSPESVDPSQLGFIGCLEDPSEAWHTLEMIHRSSSVNSVLSLHHHFFTMKKLPSESILTWIRHVHICALELSLTTAPVTDLGIILIISEGLPPEY